MAVANAGERGGSGEVGHRRKPWLIEVTIVAIGVPLAVIGLSAALADSDETRWEAAIGGGQLFLLAVGLAGVAAVRAIGLLAAREAGPRRLAATLVATSILLIVAGLGLTVVAALTEGETLRFEAVLGGTWIGVCAVFALGLLLLRLPTATDDAEQAGALRLAAPAVLAALLGAGAAGAAIALGDADTDAERAELVGWAFSAPVLLLALAQVAWAHGRARGWRRAAAAEHDSGPSATSADQAEQPVTAPDVERLPVAESLPAGAPTPALVQAVPAHAAAAAATVTADHADDDPDHPHPSQEDVPMSEEPTSSSGAEDAPDVHRALYRAHVDLRGPGDPVTLEVGLGLISSLQEAGATAEATEVAREIREGIAATTGGVDTGSLAAARSLVESLGAGGDHEAALEVQQAIFEHVASEHGANSRDAFVAMEGVAHASRLAGHPAEARAMLERVLGARVAYLGERHPETLSAMRELALTLHDLSEDVLAADLEHRAAAMAEKLGSSGAEGAAAAALPQRVEDLTAAATLLEQSHQLLSSTYGPDDPRVGTTAGLLGQVAMSVGDPEGAISWLEQARRSVRPDRQQERLDTLEMARAHLALGHAEQARPLIAAARGDDTPALTAARGDDTPALTAARDDDTPTPEAARDDDAPTPEAARDDDAPTPEAADSNGAPHTSDEPGAATTDPNGRSSAASFSGAERSAADGGDG